MRMLIALVILLLCCFKCNLSSNSSQHPYFLIFSNDGTLYKLDPGQQYVDWHSDIGSKLISFKLSQTKKQIQAQITSYFIPTIEGHFVYISKNKEILVHRQEIQPLLNICIGKANLEKQISENLSQQYFLHQKYQYFFIDLHNGKLWNIQNFFQDKIVVKQGRHALIKISKKFLKQMKPNFQVKWSAISSKVDIVSAVQFLRDPHKQIATDEARKKLYEFRRISTKQLQITNLQNQKSFQMGSSSPIMKIVSYSRDGKYFYTYPLVMYEKPMLALQDKHQSNSKATNNQIAQATIDVFPHASQYKNTKKFRPQTTPNNQNQQFDFQYCLNTFRAIQHLNNRDKIKTNIPFINNRFPLNTDNQFKYNSSQQALPPTQQISPTTYPHLFYEPQRSKDQPLIWIFLIGSLIIAGVAFYRLKVNKLLSELQKMQTIHDKKFEQIEKKLGQFQQMQKMYQVYWDKLLFRTPRRKSSDVFEQEIIVDQNVLELKQSSNLHQIQIYEYMVFQGRFLNKQALVYAVPIDGIDLAHVQHQLNDLLSCSHKSLVKLYYYTKNTQFLLIFCQKIQPCWESIQKSEFLDKVKSKCQQKKVFKSLQNIQSQTKSSQNQQSLLIFKTLQRMQKQKPKYVQKAKKQQAINLQIKSKFSILIKQILESLNYLDSKIQFFGLPLESIILNLRLIIGSQKDLQKVQVLLSSNTFNYEIQLKINAIPSILQVYKIQAQIAQDQKIKCKRNMNIKLRHDLVKLFYFINTKGTRTKIDQIISIIRKEEVSQGQDFFVHDFYDFVLNENYSLNIQIDKGHTQNQQDKKDVKKFDANQQFLNNLVCHPFLWDSKRKMLFLSDFSNYIETYLDDYKIKKLQSYAKDYQIIQTPWTKQLDYAFVKQVNQFRKYDFNSIKDLIRLIRNKVNHFHQIPKQTRNSIGKTPEAFTQYMLKLYPKLLSFAFIYAKRKKWKLHVQMK